MNKKDMLLVGSATFFGTAVFVTAGLVGYQAVQAAVSSGGYSLLIQNLAAKFKVDPSEVQNVFTETRKQQASARLDEAVTAGDITAAQKDLILSKQTEIEQKIAAIDAEQLTATARRDKMDALRTELQTWANTNNIPLRYLMFVLGGGKGGMGMRGWGGPGGFGMRMHDADQ